MRGPKSFVVAFSLLVAANEQCGSQAVTRQIAWLAHHGDFWRIRPACDHAHFSLPTLRTRTRKHLTRLASSREHDRSELPNHIIDASAFDELKRWLVDNGAFLDLHGLALKPSPETSQATPASAEEGAARQGLIAIRHYRRGDLVASIPASLHFSHKVLWQLIGCVVGQESRKGFTTRLREAAAEIGTAHATDPKTFLAFPLAFFLVLQGEECVPVVPPRPSRSEHSKVLSRLYEGWLAYLRLLPAPPSSMPMFWTAEELRALEHPIGPLVIERLHHLRCSFRDFEPTVRKLISVVAPEAREPKSGALFERLLSAYATVLSRSIKMPSGGNVFVPLVDLCNHSPYGGNASIRIATHSSHKIRTVLREPLEGTTLKTSQRAAGSRPHHRVDGEPIKLLATRAISPGDEIRVSYGAFDNPTLLLNYGLLPLKNP